VGRVLKIAGALVLSLLGMALLPLLALPYGSLDWVVYDPAYKQGYGFPPAGPPSPEIPCAELPGPGEPLAAQVNGQGIGLSAFERELAQFLDALETSGVDVQSEEIRSQMPTFHRQVLDLLIDDVLVQQAAVEIDITVTDEEIQSRVVEEISQGGGLDWLVTWLERTGQTIKEFERDVCQDILYRAVRDHVTAEITGTMEMVWARQIVVATEEEATAVLARLASGEDFAKVAREASLDDQTRDRGGDLGWFPQGPGWTLPDVEDAAFAGTPGQVRGPIQVGDRYIIVQTLDHQANRPLGANTREALRAIVFEQWLVEQREAAEIEIDPDR
jgi:foldase protein PrsA